MLISLYPFTSMSDTVTVTVAQGVLKGKKVKCYNGDNYFSFQGIPYAKPPTESLRFKVSKHAESMFLIKN
jgi:Carboxylesterase type B